MVNLNVNSNNWSVVVTSYVLSGREPGSSVISTLTETNAIDAFDFVIHSMGYFRQAIQEMRVSSITIDVLEGGRGVETIEITRD